MEELKKIILEDNIEYVIVDEIQNKDNKTYVYLSNIDDEEDFCVRKLSNDNETLLMLDDELELSESLLLFKEKYEEK